MTVWFNDPKENRGEKFSKIGNLVDSLDVNSRVEFTEGLFRLTDENTIDCLVWATNISDCKKAQSQGWTFSPCVVHFQFHDKTYQKQVWDKDTSKFKDEACEPTEFTRWMFKELSALIPEADSKTAKLSGFIQFQEPQGTLTAPCAMSGLKADGSALSDEMKEYLSSQYFSFKEVEAVEKVNPEMFPTAGKSWGKGKAAQTELEKLNDRLKFIKEQMAITHPLFQVESIYNLTPVGIADKFADQDDQDMINQMLTICFQLMN